VLPFRVQQELYEALLRLWSAEPASRLVMVGGAEVVCWDLVDPEKVAWQRPLPAEVGPARSVRICPDDAGGQRVLVGCQRGVTIHDLEDGRLLGVMLSSAAEARTSTAYNSVLLHGGKCWASKSDAGLFCWDLARPNSPWPVLEAGRTKPVRFVRCVTRGADGAVWFGADNWVARCVSSLPTSPEIDWYVTVDAPVTSLALNARDLWMGTQAGSICKMDRLDPGDVDWKTISFGKAVEYITIRRVGPVRWLVSSDGREALVASVDGLHSLRLEYRGGIRAVKSRGGWLCGLSDWRDSLVLWRMRRPSEPAYVISVQRLFGRQVQDFDMA